MVRCRQHGEGVGVVLGLGEQVGGDPLGVGGFVGDDEQFRRPGQHVDGHVGTDDLLGGRHPSDRKSVV